MKFYNKIRYLWAVFVTTPAGWMTKVAKYFYVGPILSMP